MNPKVLDSPATTGRRMDFPLPMLLILRKIRRSFFLPGKVKTYLAYAVGEIVLIVVGILLALQISE